MSFTFRFVGPLVHAGNEITGMSHNFDGNIAVQSGGNAVVAIGVENLDAFDAGTGEVVMFGGSKYKKVEVFGAGGRSSRRRCRA